MIVMLTEKGSIHLVVGLKMMQFPINMIARLTSSNALRICLLLWIASTWSTDRAFGQDARRTAEQRAQDLKMEQFDRLRARAWEYRPYLVAVWICSDGTPELNSLRGRLSAGIARRAELADPSGWVIDVGYAPSPWRSVFLAKIERPESIEGIQEVAEIQPYDKLIAVCLSSQHGLIDCKIREYDLQTQQWGALVQRQIGRTAQIDASVFKGIETAFMPLARINKVTDDGEVFIRARAVNSCIRAELNEAGEWEVNPIENSPVWIKPNDRFLPVIRRTDRQGNLAKLEPVQFTFLTIHEQSGPQIVSRIHSYHRAPLSGRTSRRAQKLALVIRPPAGTTRLKLVSRDDEDYALAGYEVWSRRPGAPRNEPHEFIGQTDWRGQIEIPASEHGLRIIYVQRGARKLIKVPLIPGLYENVTTKVPNDDTRLYAEGVIKGMETEILELVMQREVYESKIAAALERKKFDDADDLLEKYMELPTPQDLKNTLGDEEIRLKSLTSDQRELDFISTMFSTLRHILNNRVGESNESQLRQQLQNVRNSARTN